MTAKKKIVTAVIIVIAAAALCIGGIFTWKKFFSSDSSDKQKVYVQKVSSVNTVSEFNIASNSFSGVIESQDAVNVKADSSKTIKEILVKNGDSVKKGDKLFTYDVEAIQLQLDQAKLEVERLNNEIATNKNQISELENEKKNAGQDAVVSYNTQILSLQSDIAKSEYDIKAKNVEIKKLEQSTKNAFVTASSDGTVKDVKSLDQIQSGSGDDYSYNESSGNDQNVIMKISVDEKFRVKGSVNEQNIQYISKGTPVIIKSRVDDTKWPGKVISINNKPDSNNNNTNYYGGEEDASTQSSNYSFYVEPESLENLKLGQHVIIEIDNGQGESSITKTGIWLYSDFICKDGDKSYVWAKDDNGKIEKRYIEIGQTDDENGDCEIKSGLAAHDYIAYPNGDIKEGMTATTNESDVSVADNDLGNMDEEQNYDADEPLDEENGGEVENTGEITAPDGTDLSGMTDEELQEYLSSMTDEELDAFAAGLSGKAADENADPALEEKG